MSSQSKQVKQNISLKYFIVIYQYLDVYCFFVANCVGILGYLLNFNTVNQNYH